ncbi:PAS domain S-box protein [Candidatus Poribacteria bacterium]|nr:PAS domain S-box protein [Candidatus Poribacteria bacterium]
MKHLAGGCTGRRLVGIPVLILWFLLGGAWSFAASAGEPRTLAAGGNDGNPPFVFVEGGKPAGFCIEIFEAVCAEMGIEATVALKPGTESRTDLEAGAVDVLPGICVSEARAERFNFSESFLHVDYDIFVRRGSDIRKLEDVRGKQVLVQDGCIMGEELVRRGLDARIITVRNAHSLLLLLDSGQYDCAIMPRIQGREFLQRFKLQGIEDMEADIPIFEAAFAVRKGDTELLETLNEGLRRIRASGLYDDLHQDWFAVTALAQPSPLLRTAGLIVTTLLAILALILAWLFTLRRRVERRTAELREAKELVESVFDGTPILVAYLDSSLSFLRVNRALADLLGQPAAAFPGTAFSSWAGKLIPEEQLRAVLREGKALSLASQRLGGGDGREAFFDVSVIPVPDERQAVTGLILTAQDVTERRAHEQELMKREERYRTLFELSPSGIVVEDARGVVQDINPAACEFLGYGREELIGKDIAQVTRCPNEVIEQHIGEILSGVQLSHEQINVRKDGTERHMAFRETKIPLQDGRDGILVISNDITEQRAAQDSLKESQRQLLTLMSNLPGMVYRCVNDKDWTMVFVSKGCEPLTGYTDDDFHSRRVLYNDLIVPEDQQPVWDQVQQALVENRSFELTYRIRKRSGDVRWVWERGRGIGTASNGIMELEGFITDITDRHTAQEGLRESERRYRALFGTARDALFLEDESECIVDVNEAAVAMFGYSREELLAKRTTDLQPPLERRLDIYQHPEHKPVQPYPTLAMHKDGRILSIELTIAPVEMGGRTYFLSVVRDVTDRHRAEEERKKLESQIQHAQKLESLGVLAGGIAHDFNNLLTGILGNTDLALDDVGMHSPARQSLKAIEAAAKRAADLCRQMLAYSGKGRFVVEPIHINLLIDEIAHLLSVSISKKVVFRSHFASGLPPIQGDATQIRQIVMNLITNASEAIGDRSGFITLTTGLQHCTREYLEDTLLADQLTAGDYVCLEVADTGCGMDKATVARIFEPFFTTKFTGRGLGLAAVLGIVRGHKGAIKVYSEEGRGTTVKVLLPAAENLIEVRGVSAPEPPPPSAAGTILIVDDEQTIRRIGKRILERLGFKELLAQDGLDAVQVFQAHQDEIICVILDLTMPRMDGEEAFRELRQINPGVRVLMSSGYNEQEVVGRFAGKGLAGFVQKPYRAAELVAKVRQAMERTPQFEEEF